MNYRFVGKGEGILGLPHEISDDEAAELGVSDILKEAVKNGSYAPLYPPVADATSPQMEERHLEGKNNNKLKKEIANG